MTMIETETIACPACKKKQSVDVYQTINAMENPELVQKLMAGEISVLNCTDCGHVATIHTPLLFNDHRMDLKIQFYPEHLLVENPEYVGNDYLEMLKRMEKFRHDYSLFMPDLNKPRNLLVVFSLDEMRNQIKFRTQLFEMANSETND
ncbi:CpXC domain-containing protein [Desulfosarcina sp.]|uniref:CpXC domain-containing protein n=1 Tax=Desulfosarcina sp. TaxID=2027861 RepID=UPI003565D296